MQIYALFDDQGLPKGFYTRLIHAEIPAAAVPISVADWHALVANKDKRRWDGEKVVEYAQHPRSEFTFYVMLDRLRVSFRNLSKRISRMTS